MIKLFSKYILFDINRMFEYFVKNEDKNVYS